jgi:hypothetical protein
MARTTKPRTQQGQEAHFPSQAIAMLRAFVTSGTTIKQWISENTTIDTSIGIVPRNKKEINNN